MTRRPPGRGWSRSRTARPRIATSGAGRNPTTTTAAAAATTTSNNNDNNNDTNADNIMFSNKTYHYQCCCNATRNYNNQTFSHN